MLFHQPKNHSHYYFSCQIIVQNLPSFSKWFFFNYPDSLSNSSPPSLLELILSHWHIIYSIGITLARSPMRLIFLNLFDFPCLSYFSHQPYLTRLIPPSLEHFFILFSRFYVLLAFLLNWFLFCVFPPRLHHNSKDHVSLLDWHIS